MKRARKIQNFQLNRNTFYVLNTRSKQQHFSKKKITFLDDAGRTAQKE